MIKFFQTVCAYVINHYFIYEYYNIFNKNTSFTFDINTFQPLFMQYMGFGGFIVDTVREYYDTKFKIVYLHDKNQQILNIY